MQHMLLRLGISSSITRKKYLTRKVIRKSMESKNEITYYVMDMMTMLMNKMNTYYSRSSAVQEKFSGLTNIFWSHVGFMISQVARGSLPCGILAELQEQILEEFSENSFVKDVSVYIIPSLFGGSWIAHILDIESREFHVIDTELNRAKRVTRYYTKHVRSCIRLC